MDGVAVGLAVDDGAGVEVGESVADTVELADGVAVPVDVFVGLGVGDGDGVGVSVGVAERVVVGRRVDVTVGDGDRVEVGSAARLGVALGVRVGVGVGVLLTGLGVDVGNGVMVAVAVGETNGHPARNEPAQRTTSPMLTRPLASASAAAQFVSETRPRKTFAAVTTSPIGTRRLPSQSPTHGG